MMMMMMMMMMVVVVVVVFQVTVPQSDRHDTGVMYTKLTVKQLNDDAPGVRIRFTPFT